MIKTRAKTYETEHKIYGEDYFENKWIFSPGQKSNQFLDVKTYVEGERQKMGFATWTEAATAARNRVEWRKKRARNQK